MVNGRTVDIPSFQVSPGDEIEVRENSKKMDIFHSSLRRVKEGRMLPWLNLNKANLSGTLVEIPNRADIPVNVNESLIVELYSK
jgi:small subunit ribosomal protein S4